MPTTLAKGREEWGSLKGVIFFAAHVLHAASFSWHSRDSVSQFSANLSARLSCRANGRRTVPQFTYRSLSDTSADSAIDGDAISKCL